MGLSVYAIGKIFLVVIGILIALQINNRDEDRQNEARSQTMLQQLLKEDSTKLEMLRQDQQRRDCALIVITEFIYLRQGGFLKEKMKSFGTTCSVWPNPNPTHFHKTTS